MLTLRGVQVNKKFTLLFILILSACAWLGLHTPAVQADTVYVDPAAGDAAPGIQAAIAAAAAAGGGNVVIRTGNHRIYSSLTLLAHVRLIGEGGASIQVQNTGYTGIYVQSDTEISRLQIIGTATDFTVPTPRNAVQSPFALIDGGYQTQNVEISHCEIMNGGQLGINPGHLPTNWDIVNCQVHHNYNEGVYLGGTPVRCKVRDCRIWSNGYNAIDCTGIDNKIIDNWMWGNGTSHDPLGDCGGILIHAPTAQRPATGNTVRGNHVFWSYTHGIALSGGYGWVMDNIIESNFAVLSGGHGILVDGQWTQDNRIAGNVVDTNTGFGIYVNSASHNLIESNVVRINLKGIVVSSQYAAATFNSLFNNLLRYNTGEGIWIVGGAQSTMAEHNRLFMNGSGLLDSGTASAVRDNTIYP